MSVCYNRIKLFEVLLGMMVLHGCMAESNPPDKSKPCIAGTLSDGNQLAYMTVTTKCPNDKFAVSFVTFGKDRNGNDKIYLKGKDESAMTSAARHQWVGSPIDIKKPPYTYIAVMRMSDSKLVVPKGVRDDGSFYDISSTKRRVCQLFVKGSSPQRFGFFRAGVSADGTRVLGNDFGRPATASMLESGAPCEQWEDATLTAKGEEGGPKNVGKMIDVYQPGGCRFGIDDCSK